MTMQHQIGLRRNASTDQTPRCLQFAIILLLVPLCLYKVLNANRETLNISQKHMSTESVAITTNGRTKVRGEKAFVLAVQLEFESHNDAESIFAKWHEATDYCFLKEPFLYHYEASQSDQNPLLYMIMERYRSKDDYLNIHKTSEAFQTFRAELKKLDEEGKVKIIGHSYNELGIGFV